MKRLTANNEDGTAYYPHCFRDGTCGGMGTGDCGTCDFSQKVCSRLAEYERTGLTPEEVKELKDFVDSLPLLATAVPVAVMEPEWIPVEERLPESMQPILMSCESRITKPVVIAGYCDIQDVMDEEGENVVEHYHEWFKARSPYDVKLYDVVAWMPFPEPYRPQSMEKAGGGAGEGAAQGGLLPGA